MTGVESPFVGFAWKIYQRSFRQPLRTYHGLWQERQGIVIRLQDHMGRVGFGEVSPVPWFGSETLEQAQDFCQRLGDRLTPHTLTNIPDSYPACQFGLTMAWDTLQNSLEGKDLPLSAALLPTGSAALTTWETPWSKGQTTLKWKIGVAPLSEETTLFQKLLALLPKGATLRLDANGGLSLDQAERWLDCCAAYSQVEYLEQPLPADQVEAMQGLADRFPTPIALDESVATLPDLKRYHCQGWRGVFIVKPAIAGNPQELLAFCQEHRPAVVVSSVFETAIAHRYIAHRLFPNLPAPRRTPGLDTQRWFRDDAFNAPEPEILWHHLTPPSTKP